VIACGVDIPHRWMLGPPGHEKSAGRCKHCNGTRQFSNEVNVSWVETQGVMGFGFNMFAARPVAAVVEEDYD